MFKVKAKIKLFKGDGKRNTPFKNGYRPLFDFLKESKVSGSIKLIDRGQFKPGEEAIAYITFLGSFCKVGTHFSFYESIVPLGEGGILEIVSRD